MSENEELRAPFPWFGGKRRVAELVWARLGDVPTYNEPFAGSLAVLLGRPHEPRVETVNDLDCYLANFWRALQHAPDEVAYHADGPVNEADLHARHRWLVEHRPERVMTDPEYFDARIAGWWVWGQCLWIGSGWCEASKPPKSATRPETGLAPRLSQQIPQLSGDAGAVGRGVHAQKFDRKYGNRFDASAQGHGINAQLFEQKTGGLYVYLNQLAARLRRVRVCCGDWKRVLTPSVTTYVGLCGVFLDPPYAHELRERCYAEDHDISAEVRQWAIANGDNPDFRIALCGYEGEHDMPDSWECVTWKAHGGYSRTERGVANRERERIWFSPNCLKAELPLFATAEEIA